MPLTGDFNVSNALCAIAALGEAGFDAAAVAEAMGRSGGVPGRLEQVDGGQDFLAVVDYAHKPDAVTAALAALRPLTTGRLVVVHRRRRRPRPGQATAHGGDRGPAGRRPGRHRRQPAQRGPGRASAPSCARVPPRCSQAERAEVHEVGDRRDGDPRSRCRWPRAGDTVVVAGKGHETGQVVGDTTHPFDDRVVLLEELAAR